MESILVGHFRQYANTSLTAARGEMLGYIDAAEAVFSVDLEELESGEPASTEAALLRDASAAELTSYEEQHAAPEGVPSAGDRLPPIR